MADALGWSLERLNTALAALTGHLAGTGIGAFSLYPDNKTGGTSQAPTAPPPRH